jgi:hypothetical protein
MRKKCARCFDFNLSIHRYMVLDKYDITHSFLCYEIATNTQVNIDKIFIISRTKGAPKVSTPLSRSMLFMTNQFIIYQFLLRYK